MVDRNMLIAWVNDAYAMENALIPILQNHASAVTVNSAARDRMELHVEETHRHAELMRGCLQRLGMTPPTGDTMLGTMFGAMQSFYSGAFSDPLVKHAVMDYATEHFEIACYRGLQIGAQGLGETQIAEVCADIIQDEQEMAEWLYSQLPSVVVRESRPRIHR